MELKLRQNRPVLRNCCHFKLAAFKHLGLHARIGPESVTLDAFEITPHYKEVTRVGIVRTNVRVTEWQVTVANHIPAVTGGGPDAWEPEDVDIVDVGTFRSWADALVHIAQMMEADRVSNLLNNDAEAEAVKQMNQMEAIPW